MKNRKILLLAVLSLLASCGTKPSVSETTDKEKPSENTAPRISETVKETASTGSSSSKPSESASTSTSPAASESTSSSAGNEEKKGRVRINEVESDGTDGEWVELRNIGEAAIDLSGYFLTDDKGLERLTEKKTTPLPASTLLNPGELLVLENGINFDFGLGKADTATLYDKNQNVVDSYAYTTQAVGSYSRLPDGTGDFIDQASTKDKLNSTAKEDPKDDPIKDQDIKINEVNSSPDDWVEIFNDGEKTVDLSGYEIRDDSDDHRFKISDGVTLEAGKFYVVEANTAGTIYDDTAKQYVSGNFQDAVGLGGGDSVRLYDSSSALIDEYSWTEHASYDGDEAKASYGRYPDGKGSFTLTKETKEKANDWYKPDVVINEVESKDPNGGPDYVEVKNTGTKDIDVSGWYLLDNDPVGHKGETTPLASGTTLKAGEYLVFEGDKNFTFGLGKADTATIYNKDGIEVASFEWTEQANGVYARIPDGTGERQDYPTASKGKSNLIVTAAVLNEVQSNDPNKGHDWVELANPTDAEIDVSGLVLKDEKDETPYTIPQGTKIPANSFLVIDSFEFGLGKDDTVRLFEKGNRVDSTHWTGHTNPTYGRYPDANGTTWQRTKEATKGSANKFAGIPDKIAWPGDSQVTAYDKTTMFLEDSSGLDFRNGKLYAVDNGTGKFWSLDVNKTNGSLAFSAGYENGKIVRFIKDKSNAAAKGPDTEGISVDEAGNVYFASERDNSNKGVNQNTILRVNNSSLNQKDIVADKEWDITSLLPQVSANRGIEAVEWVSKDSVEGKLLDQNTNALFSMANYPDAIAEGIFFVALEDNGHVYALILNSDGTAKVIQDIDSKIGGAMALDYDEDEGFLYVASDNGYKNLTAKIKLNGTKDRDIVHLLPPGGLDVNENFEGFALASKDYAVNGKRPVYRFKDGVSSNALWIGSRNVTA